MKKIIVALSLSIFATQIPTKSFGMEANQDLLNQLKVPGFSMNYNPIPLQPKEKKALELSKKWITRDNAPFISSNGKLVYMYGASMPTILATPMQICDVELQAGEMINSINLGDTARWEVVTTKSNGKEHIIIKPHDSGIETNAVVTTDRRVYHLRLVSTEDSFTPYVGFVYANEIVAYQNQVKEQEIKKRPFQYV